MSIPCYLFVFYHLLAGKTARKALHNHTTLVVVLFNFIILTIDLPLLMNYYSKKTYVPFNPAICLVNQFVDYGLWYGAVMTMLWLSIEQHILIFHSNLIRTARGCWLFHYIPLALFSLYAPIIYFYLIFIYLCEHQYNATAYVCGGLLLRVIVQKCNLKRANGWRKNDLTIHRDLCYLYNLRWSCNYFEYHEKIRN